MAVNRIAEGYVKQPKVRFPSEFNALYDKPREYFMGGSRPATMTISYPMEIPSQTYHEELRKAQHAYDLATIASRRHFQHTTFREPRPGRVITNPINNGQRPFQTSVSGTISPLQVYPGGLGTFVYNQHHLRGGVLSSIEGQKYARNILDRRASQIRQMENPEAPPPAGNILSPIETDKLELYQILAEVLDNVDSGNYTDSIFGIIRRFAGLLIKVAVELDTEDLQKLFNAVRDTVETERSEATMSDHRGVNSQGTFLENRRNAGKAELAYNQLSKILVFLGDLIAGDFGNLQESAKRLLIKSSIKRSGLASIHPVAPRAFAGQTPVAPGVVPSPALGGLPPPPPPPSAPPSPGGEEEEEEEEEEETQSPVPPFMEQPPRPAPTPAPPIDALSLGRNEVATAYRTRDKDAMIDIMTRMARDGLLNLHGNINLSSRSAVKLKNLFNIKTVGRVKPIA